MHVTLRASLFKSPRKYVSDGKFTPEGTITYKHAVSVEGAEAPFYCDSDLTLGLNGVASRLDKGEAVPVNAVVDLGVNKAGKLQGFGLVRLEPVPPAPLK